MARAITIHAPPCEVWSWLVQMGQDRAGFYTHNWVEKLLLSGIPDVHEIHPEYGDHSNSGAGKPVIPYSEAKCP